MNKKELEIKLSKLLPLRKPDANLEQYQTDSSLAAELLWNAYLNGDIEDKKIADLGCGNGILGTGALLLGAKKAYFIDIDEHALETAKQNSHNKGLYHNLPIDEFEEETNTVVMNPPFGVQKRKADKAFLEKAMETSKAIYSIHKIESKTFIKKLAEEHGFKIENISEKDFLIKKTYPFHTRKRHPVRIGLWILRKRFK